MPPTTDEATASERRDSVPGLRVFLGPGLAVAGGVLLARAQVLEALALGRRGVAQEIAAWAPSSHWEPLLVQALMMGVVASAFAWGAGRGRRWFGGLLAAAVIFSGVSGWPVAAAHETLSWQLDGPSLFLRVVALALGGGVILALLAELSDRREGLRRGLQGAPCLAGLALVGLGLPLAWCLRTAYDVPTMAVREVVREIVTTKQGFELTHSRPSAPAKIGVLSPFKDIKLTSNEYDTGDKPAILMPPPCEVSFTLKDIGEAVELVAAAQIGYQVSNRGYRGRPGGAPSVLDENDTESVAVRFELLVDGASVFDQTIRHRSGESGQEREWRHVGGEHGLRLEQGQQVTLRTSFADEETRAFYAQHPFDCGFGDLVLERWNDVPRRRATREAPNLVVIVMDTLRADRMSCYGYAKPTTPNIDALARRGVLFESAFSTASWTWPSTASILTGLLPYEHGVLSNAACNLNLSYETVAEALQAKGYTTAAISCNPLINSATHFDQGFEHFAEGVHMRMSDEVIAEVEQTLAELADTRFLLYLQLVDPHTPHRPLQSELERLGGVEPADYPDQVKFGVQLDGLDHYAGELSRGKGCDPDGVPHPERVIPEAHRRWLSDRYDASVGTGDHYVGRILDKLAALGLDERTIVAFTSDHGEELLDHDGLAHGHAVWRELVHVPLILAGPNLPQGRRITTEVSNRHLAPTLAMLGGAELADASDAINLLASELPLGDIFYQTSKGTWNGHKHLELMGLRSELYVTHFAPQGGSYKEPAGPAGAVRFFDSEHDVHEQTDLMLAEGHREHARAEVERIKLSTKGQLERRVGTAIGAGASSRNLLAGIGYIETEGERELRSREEAQPDDNDDSKDE